MSIRNRFIVVASVVILVLVSLFTVLRTIGGNPEPSGFHNMATLSASVKTQEDSILEKQLDYVTSVMCLPSGTNKANCLVKDTNGNSVTLHILISANGESWISG